MNNSQKQTGISWGKAGLIAGFTAIGAILLYLLIFAFLLALFAGVGSGNLSSLIIALNALGLITIFSSMTGIVLSIIGIIQRRANSIAGIALNIVLVIFVIHAAFVSIRPDERGVVISALQPKGYRPDVLRPGPRWILPVVESLRTYSVAPQTYTMGSTTNLGDDSILVQTSDRQSLKISAEVTYSIDPEKVIELHVDWQNRYQDDFVRPLVRAFLSDTASEYASIEIMGLAKNDIEQVALEKLASKFSEGYLILIDFKITDVTR